MAGVHHVSTAVEPLAASPLGNLVLIGVSLAGLLGAAALLGTARELRAESRDPLNERHWINF